MERFFEDIEPPTISVHEKDSLDRLFQFRKMKSNWLINHYLLENAVAMMVIVANC